ncbi:CHAT domain-containing protein, partial [Nostoc sp. UIC 10607]|uniref:CHAT domain-containing protein n=1 Tax=Nostoc sp. UIC 10607 TaxID=3045935 RepID=UPI0039A2C84B
SALSVFTSTTHPEAWANTQNNLGNAYTDRMLGDKAENLEQGIACYYAALTVYTREAFPQQWATTQHNLGSLYSVRIQGEKSENLELAIASYHAALQVRSREAFPQQWAASQNNLATFYSHRILGDRAENLEQAIACYCAALTVYTREAFPWDWAMTQNNLGIGYRERIYGDQAENLEIAIACYQAALQVRSREAFPQEWAATQNNLGAAYSDRILGDREENLEAAIACYQNALTVYTHGAFPEKYAGTLFNLGLAYQDIRDFNCAYNVFVAAINTVELLRDEIFSGDEVKQKLAEKWNKLYQRMVEVCIKLHNYTEAIEYVERSKARNLIDILVKRDVDKIFTPEVVTQLEQLKDEIVSNQHLLDTAIKDDYITLTQHIQHLRQKQNDLENSYLPIGYNFKFNNFQAILDDKTAIIEWYIIDNIFFTFIITRQAKNPLVLQSSPEEREALINWLNEYLQDYIENTRYWRDKLSERLRHLAQILNIDQITSYLPKDVDQLILIPHRFLHLLPLHALPLTDLQHCLLDRFVRGVRYVPNCQLLLLSQKRQHHDFIQLFAIQNPTKDLAWSDIEVETISRYFQSKDVLVREAAQKEAINNQMLSNANCVHFACHGYFNFESPLNSALLLADRINNKSSIEQVNAVSEIVLDKGDKIINLEDSLTLDEIFKLNLSQCSLVTLSACETGLIDFTNSSDEYIGLPSGFLVAGSANVVSSLWAVQDFSTAFLMIKFYENLQNQTSVAYALNQAQLWLRKITKTEFEKWLEEKQLPLNPTLKINIRRRLNQLSDDEQLFQSPFYWAGFCAIG